MLLYRVPIHAARERGEKFGFTPVLPNAVSKKTNQNLVYRGSRFGRRKKILVAPLTHI